jgi:sodium-dependent phosphate transporter
VLTGLCSATIFGIVRWAVMRRKNAKTLVFWVLPPAVGVATFINIFFVFAKGAAKSLGSTWPISKCAWVAACVAVGAAAIAAAVIPLLRRQLAKHAARVEAQAKAEAEGVVGCAAVAAAAAAAAGRCRVVPGRAAACRSHSALCC